MWRAHNCHRQHVTADFRRRPFHVLFFSLSWNYECTNAKFIGCLNTFAARESHSLDSLLSRRRNYAWKLIKSHTLWWMSERAAVTRNCLFCSARGFFSFFPCQWKEYEYVNGVTIKSLFTCSGWRSSRRVSGANKVLRPSSIWENFQHKLNTHPTGWAAESRGSYFPFPLMNDNDKRISIRGSNWLSVKSVKLMTQTVEARASLRSNVMQLKSILQSINTISSREANWAELKSSKAN